MATLAQTIKGKTGLAQMSAEELAAQAGRAPATEPLETAVLGGSKDQAKMAGTPAQKQSAIRTTLQDQSPQDLATRLRREDVRRQTTEGEASGLERAGRLEQLGSLDERVQALSEERLKDVQTAEGAEFQLETLSQDPEVNDLLATIRDNPDDFNSILALNEKMGRGRGNMLSANEISDMFGIDAESIGQSLVLDSIESGELDLAGMGFAGGAQELSDLLGTDVSQLNIEELVQQVDAAMQEEYSNVSDLQASLNDPRLGPAERAEARSQLRAMGATGIRAAESELETMAEAIQESHQVDFMGEEVSVDELLGDEMMSGYLTRYIDDLDDNGQPLSDWAREFAKTNPELKQFADSHLQTLKEASNNIEDDVKEFQKIQTDNRDLASVKGGRLSDELMSTIFPDWDELSATRYNAAESPILAHLHSPTISPENQAHAIGNINKLSQIGLTEELSGLDKNALDSLGITSYRPETFQDTMSYFDTLNKYQEMGPSANMEDIAGFLNPNQSPEDTMSQIEDALKKKGSGFIDGVDLPFHKDPDGSINFTKIRNELDASYKRPKSLMELAGQGVPPTLDKYNKDVQSFAKQSTPAYDLVSPHLGPDNKMSLRESRDLANSLNFDNIETILDDPKAVKNIRPRARKVLEDKAMQIAMPEFDAAVRSGEGLSNYSHALDSLAVNPTNMQAIRDNPEHAHRVMASTSQALDALRASARGMPGLKQKMANKAIRELEQKQVKYNKLQTMVANQADDKFHWDFLTDEFVAEEELY